jgi:hypothetical protein
MAHLHERLKKNPDLGLGFSALKAVMGKHEILYQEKISSARPKLPARIQEENTPGVMNISRPHGV